jgi:hypothetical protein
MGFLIRRSDGDWKQPESTSYGNEAELQELLASTPSLLPGDDLLAVVREFGIPGVGSVDLVAVSSTGGIMVVECKLRANPQIRREVVGQALAYAGGLWRMPYEDFVAEFERRAATPLSDLIDESGELDTGEFQSGIESSLTAGDFRVVIAVDEITPELRTVVEYLNGHTTGLEVVAIELGYTKDDDIEILVPTVYGLESATANRSRPSKKWTLDSLRQVLSERASTHEQALLEQMIQHGHDVADHFYFGSASDPGMSCYYRIDGQPTSAWQLYVNEDHRLLVPSFETVRKRGDQHAVAYLEGLRQAPGLAVGLAEVTADNLSVRPSLKVADLTDADINCWTSTIEELVNRATT